MEMLRIYKDMEITYQEFDRALLRLGYHRVSDKKGIRYINEVYGSTIPINPLNTFDRKMIKGTFAAHASSMEMMGVLEHRDDIAKMIEQDRLDAAAREHNTPVGVAA